LCEKGGCNSKGKNLSGQFATADTVPPRDFLRRALVRVSKGTQKKKCKDGPTNQRPAVVRESGKTRSLFVKSIRKLREGLPGGLKKKKATAEGQVKTH